MKPTSILLKSKIPTARMLSHGRFESHYSDHSSRMSRLAGAATIIIPGIKNQTWEPEKNKVGILSTVDIADFISLETIDSRSETPITNVPTVPAYVSIYGAAQAGINPVQEIQGTKGKEGYLLITTDNSHAKKLAEFRNLFPKEAFAPKDYFLDANKGSLFEITTQGFKPINFGDALQQNVISFEDEKQKGEKLEELEEATIQYFTKLSKAERSSVHKYLSDLYDDPFYKKIRRVLEDVIEAEASPSSSVDRQNKKDAEEFWKKFTPELTKDPSRS